MAVQAGWYSNIDKVVRRMEGDAVRSGLKAAGVLLHTIIKNRLDEGYTTGAFVTGLVATTVIRGRPGPRTIWVGTPNKVAMLWELGHFNRFTQQYERVEVFRVSLEQNVYILARAFADRYMEKLNELAHTRLAKALALPI